MTDSLAPLVEHFNQNKERARVVAILSPTCAGCVHAARALQSEVTEKREDADLSVSVVWVPMLASDNEQAAARAAGLFEDERVKQFYDPARRSGVAWSRDLFAAQARRALPRADSIGLPANWLEMLATRPENAPIWDVVFLFSRGAEWKKRAPVPADWSKQTCFHAKDENGSTGTFAVGSLDKKAVQSDWFDEVRTSVDALLSGRPRSGVAGVRIAIPDDAPQFFLDALDRGRAEGLPVVIDFGAKWCAPCQRLKKETLHDSSVAEALTRVELIHVDVDEYPALASFYGVGTIPHVLFLNPDQVVVDRLQTFEPAKAFLERLGGILKAPDSEKKATSCCGECGSEAQ